MYLHLKLCITCDHLISPMLADSQRFTSPQANNWITQTLFILSSVHHTLVITSPEMHWKTTYCYQKQHIKSVAIEIMQSFCLNMNSCKTTDDNLVFYCICFLILYSFQKVFTHINQKGAQLITRARLCTGSPEETKGVTGAPSSMQESGGAAAHGCCSCAPTSTAQSTQPALDTTCQASCTSRSCSGRDQKAPPCAEEQHPC